MSEVVLIGRVKSTGALVELACDANGKLSISADVVVGDSIGINDAADVRINPATEETLQEILAKLGIFVMTFEDADLVGGILSVNHNLGTITPDEPTVFNDSQVVITPDDVQVIDEDNLVVDFTSLQPLIGRLTIRVTA